MVFVMVRRGVKVCDGGSVAVGTGVSLGTGVAVADGTGDSVAVGDSVNSALPPAHLRQGMHDIRDTVLERLEDSARPSA